MSQTEAKLRVQHLLAAARAVRDETHPVGMKARQRLVYEVGLTPQGVELALGEYLECDPDPVCLERLVARAKPASACHVLLSANVCTAAHRAIAFALASSKHVLVRPSRRDPVVAELLIQQLQANDAFGACGSIERVDSIDPRPGEQLHLYGHDETLSHITSSLPAGIDLYAHGTGFGLALVGPAQDRPPLAASLAQDLVVFDGQGCLSPRVVLLGNATATEIEAFAAQLHEDLQRLGQAVPRATLSDEERASLRCAQSTFEALGGWLHGPHHAIGIDLEPERLHLLPALRSVVVTGGGADQLASYLGPHSHMITCVAGDNSPPCFGPLLKPLGRARHCALGDMQKPPFDGPVDLRQADDAERAQC